MSIECYVESWYTLPKKWVRMVDLYPGLSNELFDDDGLQHDIEGYWGQEQTIDPSSAPFLREWVHSFEGVFGKLYTKNDGYLMKIPHEDLFKFSVWLLDNPKCQDNLLPLLKTAKKRGKGLLISG